MDRPSSASSSVSLNPSRPSTAQSSTDAYTLNAQARVRMHNSSANASETLEDPNKNPYALESHAPSVDTKLEDVVDELPDHVLSRSGTPSQWAFDDKDSSLKTSPPRPQSASLCSPPVPRKVPISVDHHLRK